MRTCSNCKEVRDEGYFYGKHLQCRACLNAYQVAYRKTQRDRISAQRRAYYAANKDYCDNVKRKSLEKHWDSMLAMKRKYEAKLRSTDLNFKLKKNLRNRLYIALRDGHKTGSAVRDLGCSIEQLRQHLESRFKPGMSWKNHNHRGWHIDHIRPLTAFNLSDRAQFSQAVHYTNLQPLWALDNIRKGDRTEGRV